MIHRWVLSLAITFLVRQIAKFGSGTDWTKVKADLEPRVRDLVPGTWFDADAVAACNILVDATAAVLMKTGSIDQILRLVADKNWDKAIAELRDLILGDWIPSDRTGVQLVASLARIEDTQMAA